MGGLELKVEEKILPLIGKIVSVKCFLNPKHRVKVPIYLFDSREKSFWYPRGKIKEEFHGREFENHAFVSPCGSIYCGRECWSRYCED